MAKRFGGKFSPEGAEIVSAKPNKFRGQKAYKSNIRVKLLYLVPFPLFISAVMALRNGDAVSMVIDLGVFATLIFAAWLLSEGIRAQEAYDDRKVARPPAFPRKMAASLLTGLGVFATTVASQPILNSMLFGAVALIAHAVSFGIDPLRKKGMEGIDEFEADRVAKAVEKAESLLKETLAASNRFNDRKLQGRVEALASSARDMFRTIENDPRDLTSARKFLSVYLKGARDATVKFADVYARKPDTETKQDYLSLITDLETSFQSKQAVLLEDNRSDLEVEIEVLSDRLKQEGLRVKA